jgi:hypothetical protein
MRSFGVIVGLILALGGGYAVFMRSVESLPAGVAPQEQIDTLAVQQTLLTVGLAERQYLAAHGSYGTLDQLNSEGLLPGGTTIRGYLLNATTTGGEHFTVIATPVDPDKGDWPTLQISESMQVTQR